MQPAIALHCMQAAAWQSFTAEHICEALREVRAKLGDDVKVAMCLDNA